MENLKTARKAKGYTQEKLSKRIGVSRSTVAMWETGNSQPDNNTLTALANLLDVTVDYLLGRTNTPSGEEDWKNIKQFALSADEGYDALTDEGKQQILELIKILPKKTDKR